MKISINTQKINILDNLGNGPTILMLHGNGENGQIFEAAAQRLAPHYRVVRPDSRGHGESSPFEGPFHYSDMADDLLGICDALALKKPLAFGFSDGAIIALLAALRRPDQFSGLILCGANLEPDGLLPDVVAEMEAEYRLTGDPLLRLMLEEPQIREEDLASLDLPVLVVAGEFDCIRPEHTEAIADAIPGAELLILKGEDHSSYIIGSEGPADLIETFVLRQSFSQNN